MRHRGQGAPRKLGIVELLTDAAALLLGAAPAVLTGLLILAALGAALMGVLSLVASPLMRAQGAPLTPNAALMTGGLWFLLNRLGIVMSVAAQAFLTGWMAPMGCLALSGQARLVWPTARLTPLIGACLIQGVLVSLGYLLCVLPGVFLNVMLAPAAAVAAWEERGAADSVGHAAELMDGSRLVLVAAHILLGLTFLGVKLAVFTIDGVSAPLALPFLSLLVLFALEATYVSLMASLSAAAYYRLSGMDEDAAPPAEEMTPDA